MPKAQLIQFPASSSRVDEDDILAGFDFSEAAPLDLLEVEGESSRSREAKDRLTALGVRWERVTEYHLRIRTRQGNINFFPTSGKVTIDGSPTKFKHKGFPVLVALLQKFGMISKPEERFEID